MGGGPFCSAMRSMGRHIGIKMIRQGLAMSGVGVGEVSIIIREQNFVMNADY